MSTPDPLSSVPRLAPTDGARGAALVPLFELYLDDGEVHRSSSAGVIVGTQPYAPGVLSFGSISREIDPQGADFRVSEMQLEMDNSTGVWSVLKTRGLTGRTCRMKLADPRQPLSEATTIYTGVIAPNWTLTRFVFRFTVVDVFAESILGAPLRIDITPDKFVAMPADEATGNMVPIVIGEHLEGDHRRKGQLPAYLIHTDYDDPILGVGTFRCVACQGTIEGIAQVFVNGVEQTEGVDWVASSETRYKFFIDDSTLETIWYITLATDPRDEVANPPNNDATAGVRVTWSGAGLYNRFFTTDNKTDKNPAKQLYEFMQKHTPDFRTGDPFYLGVNRTTLGGLRRAEFNIDSVDAAIAYYDALGVTTSFAITDTATTMRDVLDAYAQCVGLMVTSSVDGKIEFVVRTQHALAPGYVEHLVEGVHIVTDSIEFSGVSNVLGTINYSYDRDWIQESYYRKKTRTSVEASSKLGGSADIELLYVRDPAVAELITEQLLYFSSESRVVGSFRVDLHLYDDLRFAEPIAVTSGAAPSSDGLGYRAKLMSITSIGFDFSDPSNTVMLLRAVDVDGFIATGEGEGSTEFSDIFVTVADPAGIEQLELDSTESPYRTDLG